MVKNIPKNERKKVGYFPRIYFPARFGGTEVPLRSCLALSQLPKRRRLNEEDVKLWS